MDLFEGVRKVEPFLDFTWKRHKVILSNIANADTPNYRAIDLEMRRKETTLPLKTTRPEHIRPRERTPFRVIEVKRSLVGNDRNNVSLEEEMAKMVQNRIAYEVYMRMVSGSFDKLNRVIRGGRR
ncbi:MAG: flagellar basal body rod protein FlgB [Aquificota bacterium]|nr:flagellar basal body rod protein FlgB [Aquificota bacterium]